MHHLFVDGVNVLVVITELRRLVQEKLSQSLIAYEVGVACLDQLIHGAVFVLEYALLNSSDGVCQVGCSCDVKTCCGVLGSAMLYGFA